MSKRAVIVGLVTAAVLVAAALASAAPRPADFPAQNVTKTVNDDEQSPEWGPRPQARLAR